MKTKKKNKTPKEIKATTAINEAIVKRKQASSGTGRAPSGFKWQINKAGVKVLVRPLKTYKQIILAMEETQQLVIDGKIKSMQANAISLIHKNALLALKLQKVDKGIEADKNNKNNDKELDNLMLVALAGGKK